MEVECDYPYFEVDVYKLHIDQLWDILAHVGIKYKDEDFEIDLRAIVNAVKEVILNNKATSDKTCLANLFHKRVYLADNVLQLNSELVTIQNFITKRGSQRWLE